MVPTTSENPKDFAREAPKVLISQGLAPRNSGKIFVASSNLPGGRRHFGRWGWVFRLEAKPKRKVGLDEPITLAFASLTVSNIISLIRHMTLP